MNGAVSADEPAGARALGSRAAGPGCETSTFLLSILTRTRERDAGLPAAAPAGFEVRGEGPSPKHGRK
jgi:hypothetical protein